MTVPQSPLYLDGATPVREQVARVSHYRGLGTAYDRGYCRGLLNAPRAEHDEEADSDSWLEGWGDGMADWVPGTGFRDT